MNDIEEVSIDVRDVDYSWYEGLRAYLDRGFDQYYLPGETIELLGEVDPETGDALLLDHVPARAEEIEIDGRKIPCWSVGCAQLVVRPGNTRVRRGVSGTTQG